MVKLVVACSSLVTQDLGDTLLRYMLQLMTLGMFFQVNEHMEDTWNTQEGTRNRKGEIKTFQMF